MHNFNVCIPEWAKTRLFKKASGLEDLEKKAAFWEKLMTYGMLLKQYETVMAQHDITM